MRLSRIDYQKLGLYEALSRELDAVAEDLGIHLAAENLKGKFSELIKKSATQEKVVILIDEYDKPIIDYLDDSSKVEENRAVFKSFYSVLKDADEYIRLLLITGVSRFTKVSIFSDLNNLRDITLSPSFVQLVGITQTELEENFSEEIRELMQTEPGIVGKIKEWYNGYSWDGRTRVYNPFSLLSFMADRQFDNFWIKTGTPSFLIKEVRKHPDNFVFSEEDILVGQEGVDDLYVDNINPVTMMFQTGYLTIRHYDRENQLFTLGYPNREVKDSVLTHLMADHPAK